MTIFDVVASNMLVALESGGASAVTAADWASVISAMTAQISVATIVGVMATIVAGPSLAVLFETVGWSRIFELAVSSQKRLSDRQRALIKDFNSLSPALG